MERYTVFAETQSLDFVSEAMNHEALEAWVPENEGNRCSIHFY